MLQQTLAVARRIVVEQARQPRTLFFCGLFPVLMMLLFGLIYGHNPALRVGLDATPAGILIGAALFFSSLGGTLTRLLVFAAWLLGARYQGSVALGALGVALSVFSYVGIGFFLAARNARRVEDLNGPLAACGVPLLVLGSTFFPLGLMPDFPQALARINPVLHMSEALKAVAGRGAGVQDIAGAPNAWSR